MQRNSATIDNQPLERLKSGFSPRPICVVSYNLRSIFHLTARTPTRFATGALRGLGAAALAPTRLS